MRASTSSYGRSSDSLLLFSVVFLSVSPSLFLSLALSSFSLTHIHAVSLLSSAISLFHTNTAGGMDLSSKVARSSESNGGVCRNFACGKYCFRLATSVDLPVPSRPSMTNVERGFEVEEEDDAKVWRRCKRSRINITGWTSESNTRVASESTSRAASQVAYGTRKRDWSGKSEPAHAAARRPSWTSLSSTMSRAASSLLSTVIWAHCGK